MALQPVNRRSVPEDVFEQILADVLSGEMRPGEPLPSERRLAEVLGVSRPAVREALKRVAAECCIDPSTVTLPEHYELWDRDPSEDWTEIAAMAGMRVRTDRWGVITVRPEPDPQALAADWQEGPACPVTGPSSTIKTSTIPRRVVVVSTSPDVTPVIVGQWINPDADELSLVTEQRIESSTVASQEAADNLARMTGERWRRPQQSVEVTVPARPDLGYRDRVALTRQRAAVSGVFAVGGWELSLAGPDTDPALMRVTMMTRQ